MPQTHAWVLVATLSSCTGRAGQVTGDATTIVDASDPHPGVDAAIVDHDGDGLDDAYELQLATSYMPYLSLDPADGCVLDGMVVRVRRHPADPTKIQIIYDHLLQHDCGLGGHVGDDESFGVTIDPTKPAPGGILAIRAVSHQGTPCERDTECSTCPGDSRPACDLVPDAGGMWPAVYSSKDKHGNYASMGQCPLFGTCLDQCTLNPARAHPPVVNAGEPGHALVDDLTTQGFITAANGWTEPTLMHFDPWAPVAFGGAGTIATDLQDTAFLPALCH